MKNISNMEAQMMMGSQFNEQVRRILLCGPIRDETAAYFLDQLTFFEYSSVGTPINIYLNSNGGSVDAAVAILDSMNACSCELRTIALGSVCSAAVILLAAGNKGERLVSPHTRIMIHQVSTQMWGNTNELENECQEVRRLQDIYNKILSEQTGQSISKIEEDVKKDYYMSAQEAIRYGICDRILPSRKMIKPTKTKNKKSKK